MVLDGKALLAVYNSSFDWCVLRCGGFCRESPFWCVIVAYMFSGVGSGQVSKSCCGLAYNLRNGGFGQMNKSCFASN